MNEEYNKVLTKTAAYVAQTQKELEKVVEDKAEFDKHAAQAVGVLVHRGLVDRDRQDKLLDKLASDPTHVFVLMDRLAKNVGADSLGGPSEITKIAKDEKACPFERDFLGAGNSADTGMID